MVVLVAAGGFVRPASAQTASDKAAAEGLFDQGRAAMQEGDFGKACGLLERSQHIDAAVGTLLYLAECYEKSGRIASAWATFREAADAASSAKETQRARTGRERAQRLESQLSRLTIQVAPETQQLAGLVIERRDKPVSSALFNVPVPTDPGEYTITAAAPGYESWSGTITVPERAGRVSIAIPPLRKSNEPDKSAVAPLAIGQPPTAPGPGLPGAADPIATPARSADTRSSSQRTMGLIVGAAGLVGVGIGSYFGIRAFSKNGEAEDNCPRGATCNARDEARNAATAANIAYGVGLAALAGGAVLYLTAPREDTAAKGGSLHARIGLGSVIVGGTFR
jgi:hypothetical protein